MKRTDETRNKEEFAKKYGWVIIYGKKITHAGLNEEDYDETLWEIEALNDYIIDCIFWQDTNSDRATEDIDEVLDFIEEDHGAVIDDEKTKNVWLWKTCNL